jgi:hypothetical protein
MVNSLNLSGLDAMSNTIVISTQFLENYGAHDWSGRGECPQRWKPKGGDTFIVTDLVGDRAAVERCIEHRSDFSQEYVLSSVMPFESEFKESDYVEFYESPIYATFAGDVLHCEKKVLNFENQVVAIRRWVQDAEGARKMSLTDLEEPVTEQWRVDAENALYREEA